MSFLGLPTKLVCVLNYTRDRITKHNKYQCEFPLKAEKVQLELLDCTLEDYQFLIAGAYANIYKVTATINNIKTDKYLLRVKSKDHAVAIGYQLNCYSGFAQTIGPIASDYGIGLLTKRINGPSLGLWLESKPSPRQIINVSVSSLLTLCQAKEAIGFSHNDVHENNIMIKIHSKPIDITYSACGYVITIISEYQPIFIDFDFSTSQKYNRVVRNHLATDLFQLACTFRWSIKRISEYAELFQYFTRLIHYHSLPEKNINTDIEYYNTIIIAHNDPITIKTVLDYFLTDYQNWL